jgi:hypothetical protein
MWQGRRQSALGPIWFLVYILAWLSGCSFLVFLEVWMGFWAWPLACNEPPGAWLPKNRFEIRFCRAWLARAQHTYTRERVHARSRKEAG